ncbi:MAG TPA: SCO family protein, partial [Tepidisphaeraceae bacterium]|nr:SCO family protein [Tepidisphaeraceae bacterium]
MNRVQKRITIGLWGLVVLALVGLVAGKFLLAGRPGLPGHQLMVQGSDDPGNQIAGALFDAPELKLTDQNGQPFSTSSLHGHPWIADFVFTTCGGICPVMSHQMASIQEHTPAGVNLVSFTVDPEHDSPPVLKAYGQALHADFARWHFLTGTRKQMGNAEYGMKIAVQPAGPDTPIVHSDKFLLVDGAGKVVGVYDGTNADDVKRLIAE